MDLLGLKTAKNVVDMKPQTLQTPNQIFQGYLASAQKAVSPSMSEVSIAWPSSASFRSQTKPPTIFSGDGFTGFSLYPCGALPAGSVVIQKVLWWDQQ